MGTAHTALLVAEVANATTTEDRRPAPSHSDRMAPKRQKGPVERRGEIPCSARDLWHARENSNPQPSDP